MKKLLISAVALAAAISQGSFAQTLTPDQLAQRSIERRAVEAVNWGMSAVNYDLMAIAEHELVAFLAKYPDDGVARYHQASARSSHCK
jgi:hypothetical protein